MGIGIVIQSITADANKANNCLASSVMPFRDKLVIKKYDATATVALATLNIEACRNTPDELLS